MRAARLVLSGRPGEMPGGNMEIRVCVSIAALCAACVATGDEPATSSSESPLNYRDYKRSCDGPNLLLNPDFALHGGPTLLVTPPEAPVRAEPSTAASWYALNLESGSTAVAVYEGPYGRGLRVMA